MKKITYFTEQKKKNLANNNTHTKYTVMTKFELA